MVPIANLLAWLGVGRNWKTRLVLLGGLNSAALVVSLYYTFVFLPVMPFAAIGLIGGHLLRRQAPCPASDLISSRVAMLLPGRATPTRPVLVTTGGPDRILVRCFPAPPRNGEIKIRIGVTVPLILDDPASGRLPLPFLLDRITERNTCERFFT